MTATGKRLVDEVTETHLATESDLLAALTQEQQRDLAELLGVLAQGVGL